MIENEEILPEMTEEFSDSEADQDSKFEIINYPADTTLKGFYDQWKTGQLIIPKFQRNYVWDVKRASKLIESFLLGLPVPNVFLYKKKNEPGFLIIDGQQRITSIVRFIDEHFDDKKFRLRSVSSKYEGLSFSDLADNIRFQLENTVLRAIIIQQLSPNDDTSIYKIFERLNTGGVNLNPMEVRQSLAFEPFVDMIRDVNTSNSWTRLLGVSKPDKRLKDVELILRVMALRNQFHIYEKPMKGFLTEFTESMRGKIDKVDEYRNWFISTCDVIFKKLGDRPFNYRGRINYGVLDSVLATRPDGADPVDLAKRFENLKSDAKFNGYVTSDTSDTSVVRARLAMSSQILWQ
jgi:hypothetical protein